MKKTLALLLALAMILSMAACSGSSTPTEPSATSAPADTSAPSESVADVVASDVPAKTGDYDEDSAALYEYVLGDFYGLYKDAVENSNASEAWAEMAIAEAKLLEAGVMLPMSSSGGRYAISRIAPYTHGNVGWGLDAGRYQYEYVTTDLITTEDRTEIFEHYAQLKGTGEYRSWLKDYLEGKGYTLKDSLDLQYTSDPKTWDILNTSRAADSAASNFASEFLMYYDGEGVQQPGLAESVSVSDDGLTYTFKIREGEIWVDSQGRKVGDVNADSFVAAFQHMLDAQGGLETLIDGIVAGAHEYITGKTTNFEDVGVKAVDEYTLEYTLEAPCRYFLSMLSYNPFAPMCRAYYESKGGKFGADFDASASDYTYGTTPDNIAYCGPYLVTSSTAENSIVFGENPSYWNAENMTIKTMTWRYNDNTDVTKAYNDTLNGLNDSVNLSSATLELAKSDGNMDKYAYITQNGGSSYMAFININRAAYANASDDTVAVSAKTDEQKEATYAALLNKNFRNALTMSVDRETYNGNKYGDDVKKTTLRNSYTKGTFVSLSEDVTVDINGTPTTFPAGTAYGAIMQAQMDADGFPVTVFDPSADSGLGSSDGFDGWYNPTAAKEYLQKAIEELSAQGVEISKENPIVIDYPAFAGSETNKNASVALKQSVEAVLDGYVVVNLVECATIADWYNAGYYADVGSDMNFDIYDVSGWGPDYGDPTSYLDTFRPDYNGYMTMMIGVF